MKPALQLEHCVTAADVLYVQVLQLLGHATYTHTHTHTCKLINAYAALWLIHITATGHDTTCCRLVVEFRVTSETSPRLPPHDKLVIIIDLLGLAARSWINTVTMRSNKNNTRLNVQCPMSVTA